MRLRRPLIGLALGLFALSLAGCGRKGPLELPADVQAEREAKAAQQQQADAAANGGRPKLSAEGAKKPVQAVEGDPGHRPPAAYPFPLDFLL